MLPFDQRSRLNLRGTIEQLVASLDAESLESLKQSLSEQQLAMGESFMDFNRQCTTMDARTGVTLDLQQKMKFTSGLSDEDHLDRRDIVNSLYNAISAADNDLDCEAFIDQTDVKDTSGTVVSFSGFLCLQNSYQTPTPQSPNRSENSAATQLNSPKTEPKVDPLEDTPKAYSSSKAATKGRRGEAKVANSNNSSSSSSAKKPEQSGKKAKKVEFRSPITEVNDPVTVESAKRQKGSSESPAGVYLDDNTKRPLNPPKKAHVARGKIDEARISQLLLNQFNQVEPRPKPQDTQGDRIYSRLKDIAIGKSTKGYQNYIKKVPIDKRAADDPQTPNMRENISAARFQVIYRKWRTSLHKYDNI